MSQNSRILSIILALSVLMVSTLARAQTWTTMANTPSFSGYNPTLLTDGTVLVQDGDNSNWYKLTPDQFGNYSTGTWTQVASTPGYGPLYYASAVLPDGRVFTMGGEYNLGNGPLWQNQGFIYDPVADSWTSIAPPSGWDNIGDMGSVMFPNGKLMICDPFGSNAALFDPLTNTFLNPYGTGKFDGNDEEGLTLLPNGTILTVDSTPNNSEIFNPATATWTFAGNTPATLVGGGEEIGPQVLRPDGTVICFGGGGHNCIYNTKTSTWSQAPDFPSSQGQPLDCADAPACLLPNGNVLVMTSPGLFNNGVVFFEWDGTNLNPEPTTDNAPNEPSYVGNMLMLPNGQVMLTDQSSTVLFYNPTGGPNSAWAPTITTAPTAIAPGFSFKLSGTQLNGLSTCSAYGDDEQNATNYPLIRVTNTATGHVFYCREFNPSTMGICTGSQIVSTNFTVPQGIEMGPSTIQVVTNGIPSKAVAISVVPVVQLTITPSSVVGGTTATGTISLFQPAPAGGSVITLTSNNSAVTVPASVTVAAGATKATFSIGTVPVTTSVNATITAVNGTFTATASINVFDVASVSVSPTSVVGSNSSTGTVVLSGAAATGGTVVALKSNSSSAVVPATVTVPAGSTSVTFTITTTPVATATTVTVSATAGNTVNATLTITPAALTGITVAPTSVIGGNSSTATLTLNGPSAAGGSLIGIKSSSSSATVPSGVTVPAGATTATFTISTVPVASNVTATITASQGVLTQTAALVINQPLLSGIILNPTSVVGGSPSTGTVTLTGAAGPSGVVVNLSSSNGVAFVPTSITISAGGKSGTFPITTTAVASNVVAVINAGVGTSSATANLTIEVPLLSSVTVAPTTVVGGNTAVGTVTFARPAPAGGAVVSLSATAGGSVPATVTVPAGASSGTFTVLTSGEATNSSTTITATLSGTSKSAVLNLTPAKFASVSVAPNPVVGGNTATGTVSMNGFAPPSGVVVTLSASGTDASVPASVQIPGGAQSATFPVKTKIVTTTASSMITAVAGGITQTTTVSIIANSLASVSVSPSTIVGGSDATVLGTVTFTGPAPAAGETISLTSSDTKYATVPAVVRLLSGKSSVTFSVVHKLVTSTQTITITAKYGGLQQTAALTLTPFQVTSLSFSPATVGGGAKSTGTVQLNAEPGTGSGSISVKLSSSSSSVTVPVSVLVGVGKTAATFSASTKTVSTTTAASITATFGSSAQQATLTVMPVGLASLAVSPSTVEGSSTTPVNGTVTLTGPAPTGGIVVTLTSSNAGAASVPGTVTVLAGQTSAKFKVTHSAVSTSSSVTLSASFSGSTKTATLTVTP